MIVWGKNRLHFYILKQSKNKLKAASKTIIDTIAKLIFYVLATISVLFDIFLLFTTLHNMQKLPNIKKAEIIIFIIAFIIMLTGTIIGFRQANYHSRYAMAIAIFIF